MVSRPPLAEAGRGVTPPPGPAVVHTIPAAVRQGCDTTSGAGSGLTPSLIGWRGGVTPPLLSELVAHPHWRRPAGVSQLRRTQRRCDTTSRRAAQWCDAISGAGDGVAPLLEQLGGGVAADGVLLLASGV